ncbi:hypothetical protein ACFQ3Z_29635 [Streptomyces nogalater]
MVFDNIFNSAGKSAGLFSVTTDGSKPQPGADVDFEDADDGTYDDTSTSLFDNAIHGASSRAKVVQETSPEARAILGFLGSFVQTTQASADAQARYARDPGSVSTTAAAGMQESSTTITKHSGLQRTRTWRTGPRRTTSPRCPRPRSPHRPRAHRPGAGAPKTPKTLKPTAEDPPAST